MDQNREETKHQTEWCAEADWYRCERKQVHEDTRKMYRTTILVKKSLERWRRRHLVGLDLVRRMDRQGEVLKWCLFLWRRLTFFLVKKETWRVVVLFLGENLLDRPEDLSDGESEVWVDVPVVPDVTDVPLSPSSVVAEFRDGFSCCSDRDFVEPQSLSFSKKRSLYFTVTQEEMRYESSQSAIQKENDAAHAAAKFVFVL